jgi:hypothetical protein
MSKQERKIKDTCPNCKHTGEFKEISQRVYAPPLASQKTVSRITQCPNCTEKIGSIIRSDSNWEYDEGL